MGAQRPRVVIPHAGVERMVQEGHREFCLGHRFEATLRHLHGAVDWALSQTMRTELEDSHA